MLKKLLKYDFRAILKYWWIVAASSVGVSLIGGISLRALISLMPKEELFGIEPFIALFSGLGMLLALLGLCAFLIASEIFIYVRLYKHFFSDEGYLTFTLPVRRSDILNSKIISGLVINLATLTVILIDVLLIFLIGDGHQGILNVFLSAEILFRKMLELLGPVSLAYIAEILILILCMSVTSYLFIAFCMTFAATIAKKHKIFAAIGIYYIVSAVLTFAGEIAVMIGVVGLAGLLGSIPPESTSEMLALILLSICALATALTYGLYTLKLYLLEKKLNLT